MGHIGAGEGGSNRNVMDRAPPGVGQFAPAIISLRRVEAVVTLAG